MLPSSHLGEKLTVAFTCTSLPFNLNSLLFLDVVLVSDLNNFHWRIDAFGKKRHGSADLHTPIHPHPVGKIV